jgi:ABC-2 type transport system ATP-binding protein
MAPALSAHSLSKSYGDRVAFEDVSFEIGYGEVFGFLGPNGAGKTTTVRTLATLLAPTEGTATVAGLDLKPENGVAIRSRISVMPESPGLYLKLSVADNLRCFADLHGVDEPGRAVASVLETVHLSDRSGDPCGALSKGLRQRVALARALLSRPQVLFLDEPTSGLDPASSLEVHDLIQDLRRGGVTIFLTTHRLGEAERLCDRVAILNQRLITVGPPAELRDRLFSKSLRVETAVDLTEPGAVFDGLAGVSGWRRTEPGGYLLDVSDRAVAAPAVTRALVGVGADVLAIAETRHSLEDVYMELIGKGATRELA